jgi:hypothetical protein
MSQFDGPSPQKKKKKNPMEALQIEGSILKFLPFGPTIYL